MVIIQTKDITKDYGMNRGVFNLSLKVNKGEVYGFLGPNGAGKTTTVRQLLGFIKSDSGHCSILGLDCWANPSDIQQHIGYVPGEIAFPKNLTGYEMIERISDLRKMTSLDRAKQLIEYFELDPRGDIKRMSKGMKQKIALVIAFMHDPEIVILDEPTSGLDPLMQAKFVDLIKEEKKKGTTIFMSSHMFDEVEKTCDRVEIIRQGRIIASVNMKDLEHSKDKEFEVKITKKEAYEEFKKLSYTFTEINDRKQRLKIMIEDKDINLLLGDLSKIEVTYITEVKFTLEKYFMKYYAQEEHTNV